jgi:hypothetical protein
MNCTWCVGHGQIPSRVIEPSGDRRYEFHLCPVCGGSGMAQGPYNELVEPPSAGLVDCPLCRQRLVATVSGYERQDVSEIPF